MTKEIDITGKRHGRLLVVERAGTRIVRGQNVRTWRCLCDCGNEVFVTKEQLVDKKSCGCLRKDMYSTPEMNPNFRHGECTDSHSRLYGIYCNMLKRCLSQKDAQYKNYGGRGITVCDDWLHDPASFLSWARCNGYRDDLTLDRIDVNSGYSPDNCRFVDRKTQGNNTTRNHHITYNGKTLTMSEWADETGIPYYTLRSRINILHWPAEKALTQPVRKMHYQR